LPLYVILYDTNTGIILSKVMCPAIDFPRT
jgi:hypothetical protein